MADKEYAIHDAEKNGVGSVNGSSVAKRPTFMQRYRAHMKKWWWLHLIIFIALTLLIVLLITYVAFPRISQQGVDDSTIEVTGIQALEPTPTSIRLIQDAFTHSNNTYHPYLDPFDASLSLAGQAPYGMVRFPGTQSGTSVPGHVDQIMQITNITAFTDYNTALLNSETVTSRLNGSTWLHEMALPATNVAYDKSPVLTGFNSLKGFNITEFAIQLTPNPDGTNINGTVFIPNPTVITFALGNATFNTYVNDTLIGNATLKDLVLQRGNNTYPMVGYTDQALVLNILESYPDGVLPIKIIGNSSIYNGLHLEYYEKALQQNVQRASLNVSAALQAAAGGGGLR